MTDKLTRDLRDACRHLVTTPWFTLTALVLLGVGIGGTAAVFSAVDALLLRPHPFADSRALVNIYQDSDDGRPESNAYPAFQDMAAMTDIFSGVAAVMPEGTATLVAPSSDARSISVEYATSSYLPLLGLQPARGRWFVPAEDVPSAPPVAVITYAAWQRRFGASPEIVGSTVSLSGAAVTIVGVGPQVHDSSAPGLSTEFWLSISSLGPVGGAFRMAGLSHRDDHWFQVVARLKPGVSAAAAQAAMTGLAERLAREFPESDRGRRITVLPTDRVRLHPGIDPALYPAAAVPLALAALVLTVVCSNLANLMLVRGGARRREFAVRLALGASRGQIVRALAFESLLLAVGGGLGGLMLAAWIVKLVGAIALPLPLPVGLAIQVDVRVMVFGFIVSMLTGLAFGVLPAIRNTRRDLLPALKSGPEPGRGRGFRFTDLRRLLVVAQVAVSLTLVVCAGVLVRSLINLSRMDLGFDPRSAAVVTIDPDQAGLRGAQARDAFNRLRERIAARPGVVLTAVASRIPVTPIGPSNTLVLEGASAAAIGTDGTAEVKSAAVTPDYFSVMHLPILHGRPFLATDGVGAEPVAIVSEAMARRFWGAPDAVGRRYRHSGGSTNWIRIVGVARDVPVESPGETPRPFVYRPLEQRGVGRAAIVVRTAGDPRAVLGAIREEVRSLDPRIPVLQAGTLAEHVGRSLTVSRLAANLLAGFGALAVGVASLGIYSVVAFGVARRRNEMGIRMAIGATGRQVTRLVVREMMTVVAAGIVCGLLLASLVTPALGQLLLDTGPRDPVTFALVAGLLSAVALVATWLPARRAAEQHLPTILRAE